MGEAWIALGLSLKVALWATALDLVVGVAIGWVLARKRFPGRELLDALMTLLADPISASRGDLANESDLPRGFKYAVTAVS